SARPTTHRGASWRQSRCAQSRFWIQPWDSVKPTLPKVPPYSSIDNFERKCFGVAFLRVLRASVVNSFNTTHHEDTETTQQSRYQHNLADVLSFFQIAMRCGDLIERKSAIDVRSYPAFRDTAHDFARPTGNLFAFAPHMTEV